MQLSIMRFRPWQFINNDPFMVDLSIFLLVVILTIRTMTSRSPRVFRPFSTFLDIREAEALLQSDKTTVPFIVEQTTLDRSSRGRNLFLASLAICQTLAWSGVFWYMLLTTPIIDPRQDDIELVGYAFVACLAWIYATLRPAMHPTETPPYDLLCLYFLLLLRAVEVFVVPAWYSYVYQVELFPIGWGLFASTLNLMVIITLLTIVFSTPIAIPGATSGISKEAIGTTISPEDYTSLWKWISFMWMVPLTQKESLYNEEDVWRLSPTMATRALYSKYAEIGKLYRSPDGQVSPAAFFQHWWACNSLDIILVLFLATLSILFQFSGPFFLKLILECITEMTKETDPYKVRYLRALALLYAFAAFICALAKAGTELHHLFYGRRAGTRTRNETMVTIYDKALRRRDAVALPSRAEPQKGEDKDGVDPAKSPEGPQEAEEKGNKKEAADLGKLVNLMSSDTGTLETTIYMTWLFYGAPIQLTIAFLFLYNLLGWSAFAGITVFAIVAPFNHIISGRAAKIFERRQQARDKKMSVLNEMISEIKFIKFLASEDGWMKRAIDARAEELKYIRQSGYINILFSFFWNGTPIGVSVFSIWAYIWSGHRLSVATAFTAVQLFSMVTEPLSVLPMVLVQVLQLRVSITRISEFLSEPEVDAEVSSLKRDDANLGRPATDQAIVENEKFGIINGFFLWSPPDADNKEENEVGTQAPWWRTRLWFKGAAAEPLPSTVVPEPTTNPVIPLDFTEDAADASARQNGRTTALNPSSDTSRHFELRDINVLFPLGELSLVTGPFASGKSGLLRAMLGEMYTMPPPSPNSVTTRIFLPKNPTILDESTGLREYCSYAAQTPWLENMSIKENILFGSEYNEGRYKQVLECCALKLDLEALEDGDETEIGERGASLSGGQRARVALARAVYAPTRYVLLDDPLSAVDSHTAQFLFDRLLRGPLLAKRTVILVTHHVELVLPGAGYLVRMVDGRIETQGKVSDLRERGVLQEITSKANEEEPPTEDSDVDEKTEDGFKDKKAPRKFVEDEERAQGRVKWSIYMTYIRASAYSMWAAYLFLTMLRAAIQIGEKVWMQIWGEAYERAPAFGISSILLLMQDATQAASPVTSLLSGQAVQIQGLPSPDEHPLFYVSVFATIGFVLLVVEMLGTLVLILGAYRASKLLFSVILVSVTRATMRWHETTVTGRILNRFSKDFNTIDTAIGFSFAYSLSCLSTVLLSVITVIVISPVFILPGIFIGIAYVWISKIYLRTTRPLKRLESTTLSPIYASFRTPLEGLATIRAFSAERRFIDRTINNLDISTKCFWACWMMNRWSMIIFDTIGAMTILVVMTIAVSFGGNTVPQVVNIFGNEFVAFQGKVGVSSGFEALFIVSAMGFTSSVYWACRFLTQLELDLNSVERITEYTVLPQEPPAIIESNRPPAYWPSGSSPSSQEDFITVEDLVIKYAPDLPPVLHGVSFNIRAQERVGLVGRTGSGKSTLATSLLRFVEPNKGRIVIDGIDITTIGVHDLRSRVTFIPQDSVLFSGTIRENLDPFNEHTDTACLDVLRRVHLVKPSPTSTRPVSILNTEGSVSNAHGSSSSTATPGPDNTKQAVVKLDSVVTSGGSNFSHGQRQLIALARALLRKTSMIIMDEATSSIDLETDKAIQEALREEIGSNCVVLTIAHRLQTIMDYDRVIVMDAGTIVENGAPSDLIANPGGMFHSMCVKAGIIGAL